ncbi:hypothetical protein Q8F55_002839 [Vanrija albida]|uniref:Metallo-beta-lactamase domain-containing protein n=1 Tax=Vanrija albida TaxID=181172 RepID=A0ABR3QAW1_9TREE
MPKEFYIREELTALHELPARAADVLADDTILPVCATCATQYPGPRDDCELECWPLLNLGPVCEDPRQWVPGTGQAWTSLHQLVKGGRRNHLLRDVEDPRISLIATEPFFAIGQTPIVLETAEGSVIWDCSAVITEPLVAHLVALKRPLKAIAISHPHFFCTSLTWARALGVPLYINELDREWYARAGSLREGEVVFWRGTHALTASITLVECGGHFPGSSVLYWDRGGEPLLSEADARAPDSGLLLVADTIMVQPTQKGFTFMWSYPNAIPLHPTDVLHIQKVLAEYDYDSVTCSWPDRWVRAGAKRQMDESVETYLSATQWKRDSGGKLVPKGKA